MDKIVISLSTVPERMTLPVEDGFKAVIKSLCEQNYDNTKYEVHLNLPEIYKVTGEKYIKPEWLENNLNEYPHLKIFTTEDIGPATKVVPTIQRETPDTLLIVVDDDLIYHPDMINEHIKWQSELPGSAIVYDGRSLVTPKYGDLRDSWVLTVKEVLRVKEVQHYKSVSYYVRYFQPDFFERFVGKTMSDDILISYYFRFKNIKMFVVPYHDEIDKVQTFEQWQKFNGVCTFPVLRHAHSLNNTGANHPDMFEPKFYRPRELDFALLTPFN